MSRRIALLAASCTAALALTARPASATPISFQVTVNTAPLIGNVNGPFSLDFQLIDGSGTVPNQVTLSNFNFNGGGAVGSGTATPGVAGSLSSLVTLDTTANAFNEFYQQFTPGTSLSFNVSMTRNVDPGPTPDAFSFAILDKNLFNIPTTGLGDALVLVNIDSATFGLSNVQTFASTAPAGVTAAAVPEPASLVLVSAGLLIVCSRLRRPLEIRGRRSSNTRS
jgi:hypothetical protein